MVVVGFGDEAPFNSCSSESASRFVSCVVGLRGHVSIGGSELRAAISSIDETRTVSLYVSV